MTDALAAALALVLSADADLREIVGLSLRVTGTSTALACLVGIPLGAVVGATRFAGRGAVVVALNALMGLPSVLVGLLAYLLLSASGPLGTWGLLYTPAAMILAQAALVTPLVAALTRQAVEPRRDALHETLLSIGAGPVRRVAALAAEARLALVTVALAAFGRAVSEVGAVILVGGNIAHHTRVMTTAIALETSRGQLELAVALGLVLLAIVLLVNLLAATLRAPLAA